MKYNVILIDNFKKESKRLIKKFPSLRQELQVLNDDLENNPATGTPWLRVVIKYGCPSPLKEKVKAAEPG